MSMRYILGKCDYNGSGRKNCEAEITWELKDGRFSMRAEIWNPRHTDIYCGGQCVDTVAAFFPHDAKAKRMCEIWRRWHLNDMRAGSQAQEDWLRQNPGTSSDQGCEMRCARLAAAGLNPDPETGYRYGHAWLKEELPAEIIAEIESWGGNDARA